MGFENKKILIVDDERQILVIMKRVLEKTGCKVDLAGSGEEAIMLFRRAFTNCPYNMVILDRDMPGMNGEIVLIKLKDIDPSIRAILHSGNISSEVFVRFDRYGFIDRLAKPALKEEILDVISLYF